jgi:PleD family two-component response regulator
VRGPLSRLRFSLRAYLVLLVTAAVLPVALFERRELLERERKARREAEAAASAPAPPAPPSPTAPASGANGSVRSLERVRVLVVDDDAETREVMAVALGREGAIVTTAPDYRRRVLEAGFEAHVAKPVPASTMAPLIASLLEREGGLPT